MTDRRLIEVAFPLKQASLDSVHEKNVRHGHISSLHIWPARRPLAACRAALIAALLPDPGSPEGRQQLCERIGGKIIKQIEKKKGPGAKGEDKIVEKTVGGVLHWGREAENKVDIDFFREEIRKAFGGRAPRVLDPFAGGGAIPLEAMRLGCEVTAIDINPVAWFILKCTLEYPQGLTGQKRPLPEFVRRDPGFMAEFFEAQGFKGAGLRSQLRKLGLEETSKSAATQESLRDTSTGRELDPAIEEHTLDADLAWHVRAWGSWVLGQARRELAGYYPVYADFQPLRDVPAWRERNPHQEREMTLVPARDDGTPDVAALNAEFSADYLGDGRNPRWIPKQTVTHLWARTVKCKNCRAIIPLLKTCWLARRNDRRVLLRMVPRADGTGVTFAVDADVPSGGGNNAQRRENDRRIGLGTMSGSGAFCPCCGVAGTIAMQTADIRAEGIAGRLGTQLCAVIVEGPSGKEYRIPTPREMSIATSDLVTLSKALEIGPVLDLPDERIPVGSSRTGGGSAFTPPIYGLVKWSDLFTPRQLVGLLTLLRHIRAASAALGIDQFGRAVAAYQQVVFDSVLNRASTLCTWTISRETVRGTFARFALPITWDFCESVLLADTSGGFPNALEIVAECVAHVDDAARGNPAPIVRRGSAIDPPTNGVFDAVVTDPPYYAEIPYSDLADFFHVWIKRGAAALEPSVAAEFQDLQGPKWDHQRHDGELVDDAGRFGDAAASKAAYEDGMARSFVAWGSRLSPTGRMVVVFANKKPDAWETLVSALIRSGFVVDASWPIQTEMGNRTRALGAAALASSVWLVSRKRDVSARPGWDNVVLDEMRKNIGQQLREFWDAGIRGPDFVWAATGPALEAYSKHPIVKKANDPGQTMTVSEFLRAVRRMVVEFVVGRVLGELTRGAIGADEGEGVSGLDDVTTYYLLHRHDFGMNDAPAGACILYALSCNLSEGDLAGRYGVLLRSGGDEDDDGDPVEGDADAEGEVSEGSGSTFKLRPWKQRRRAGFGQPAQSGTGAVPIVDMAHYLMHLWADGDVHKVDAYINDRGLRRNETFKHVLQALIELSAEGSDERSVLERISNHLQARGQALDKLKGFDEPADSGVSK